MQESLQIDNTCNGIRYGSQIRGIEMPTLNGRTLEMTDSIVDSYDVEDETKDETSLDQSSLLTDDRFNRPIPSNYYYFQPAPVKNDMLKTLEKDSPARSFWTSIIKKIWQFGKKLIPTKKPGTLPTKQMYPTTKSIKPRQTTKRSDGSNNDIDIQIDVEIHKETTKPEQGESTEYENHPLTSHLTHKHPNYLSFQPVR